ncbi:hypothetical protein QBC46DRAFT_337966 [Diplogelasinospora grovesii]|uniref:Uncharacterized protein n=1 Tax=Diplogelasinospora grovesii TaxID=303347 RepID=A0AAN6NF22_9PEZI|nr:hypothetical protein QBC46DRAFT_337966 [Diplogelasinospora grovesii]
MVEDLDLLATVTRVRLALIQSQIRDKSVSAVAPSNTPVVRRRRRSTVTAVYSGSKDGVPLFTKQRVVRVVP